jgi:hypothetical protein
LDTETCGSLPKNEPIVLAKGDMEVKRSKKRYSVILFPGTKGK